MPSDPILNRHRRVIGFSARGSTKSPRLRCYVCGEAATCLCDHLLTVLSYCGRPMCAAHQHSAKDGKDYCTEHSGEFSIFRSWEMERQREAMMKSNGEGGKA